MELNVKTIPQILNIINTEVSNRNNQIQTIVQRLQAMKIDVKDKNNVSEETKINLIKAATEINENKAIINALEKLKQEIEN